MKKKIKLIKNVQQKRKSRKLRTGIVVSNKMEKTIVVKIISRTRHRLYGKTLNHSSRIKVHDEKNISNIGDFVIVSETRPFSSDKRWYLQKIKNK